jgi:hypothetical protein
MKFDRNSTTEKSGRSNGCEDEVVVFVPGVPHPALVSVMLVASLRHRSHALSYTQ